MKHCSLTSKQVLHADKGDYFQPEKRKRRGFSLVEAKIRLSFILSIYCINLQSGMIYSNTVSRHQTNKNIMRFCFKLWVLNSQMRLLPDK